MTWRGRSLVAHVVERLTPQAGNIHISCNRNRDSYAAYASVTAADIRPDYQGPLAGLEAAAGDLAGEYILVAPCDMPLLPRDLAPRLLSALKESPHSGAAYASVNGYGQYLCALIRRTALGSLGAYLDSGERAVRHWYAGIDAVPVDFSDEAECFLNLNELEQEA